MNFEDYQKLLHEFPSSQHKVSKQEVLALLERYYDSLPSLPFRALLKIRKLGSMRAPDLHEIVTTYGFTQLAIDEEAAKHIARYRSEMGIGKRGIKARAIPFVGDANALISYFHRYTGHSWQNGQLTYRNSLLMSKGENHRQLGLLTNTYRSKKSSNVAAQEDLQYRFPAVSKEERAANSRWFSNQKIAAEDSKFLRCRTKEARNAAKAVFLKENPDYRMMDEVDIISHLLAAMKDGTINPNANQLALADYINSTMKVIRHTKTSGGGGPQSTFHLFYTSGALNQAFKKILGNGLAQYWPPRQYVETVKQKPAEKPVEKKVKARVSTSEPKVRAWTAGTELLDDGSTMLNVQLKCVLSDQQTAHELASQIQALLQK